MRGKNINVLYKKLPRKKRLFTISEKERQENREKNRIIQDENSINAIIVSFQRRIKQKKGSADREDLRNVIKEYKNQNLYCQLKEKELYSLVYSKIEKYFIEISNGLYPSFFSLPKDLQKQYINQIILKL